MRLTGTYHFVVPFFHNLLPYLINPTYLRGKKIVIIFIINYLNYAYFNSHKIDEFKM